MQANHKAAKAIFELIEDEAEARGGYEGFLADNPELPLADVNIIREIQADEANHLLILQAMAKRYDGGISATADGAEQAIMQIASGINEGGDDNEQ